MTPTLSPADWARLSPLFDQALDLPERARGPWLAGVEAQDPATAAQLRALLAAHADQAAAARLERGPQLTLPTGGDAGGLAPGQRIGPWRLLAPLGSGGMATVWRAARADGAYQREVALKLPLHRLPDAAAALRFERECDILARLEHPNIARLYDADLGGTPLPWLAIEQVQGLPLDQWCRQQRLALPQRLALFIQVLQAVQYAHSHLVLHRDLKASNILVTAQGQVKLLDFGIASLLQEATPAPGTEGTADTARSAGMARAMTPAYAAPEQIESGPLSTATDLYAAGVVLFDLLTGARPYSGPTHTPAELEQAILRGPLRPASQACTADAAAACGLALPALRRALAGDIDAILARALQREPQRRYASAQDFAADLQRHLDRLPIRARPRTPGYVLGRFVRRHRALVGLAGVASLGLALALTVAVRQASIASDQERRALAAQATSEAGAAFMADLLNDALRAGRPVNPDEWLARAERMARQSFAGKPDQLAGVLWMVAQRASDWEGQDRSRALVREALALARDPDLRDQLSCEDAFAQSQLGELAAASQRLQALADQASALPAARACALGYLAFMAGQGGRLSEALALQQRALGLLDEARAVPEHVRAAMTARLALFNSQMGNGRESDRLFAQALAVMAASGRERSQMAWVVRNEWSIALNAAGDPRRSLVLGQQNLALMLEDGVYTPKALYTARGVGLTAMSAGRYAEAQTIFDTSLAQATAASALTPEILRAIECDRAVLATRRLQLPAAAQALARADQVTRRASSADAFYDWGCRMARAELDIARGAHAAALATVQALLAEPGAGLPPLQNQCRALAARAQLGLGAVAAARAEAEQALAIARQLQADRPHSVRSGSALLWLGAAQAAAGDAAGARESLQQAVQQLQGSVDPDHPWLRDAQARLAALG